MTADLEFPWIAIDGCIGAGKTSLARILAKAMNLDVEYERAREHPLLPDFYEAPLETALQTELGFVLIHYHQISRVVARRRRGIVTDFTLAKDLLFGRMNLTGEDLELFLSVYNHFVSLTKPPTFLIKLDASDELLWQRVQFRDRPFERDMPRDYLSRLNREYNDLAALCGAGRVLRLCSDDFDVVNNADDEERIVCQMAKAIGLVTPKTTD